MNKKCHAVKIILFSVSFVLFSCNGAEKYEQAVRKAEAEAVSNYIDSLDESVLVSQLFLVNIEGNESYRSVERTGALYGSRNEGSPLVPGGCLLFSYNISDTPEKTHDFIRSINDFYLSNGIVPPYIAVDQEGGDVNRLRRITSRFPSQKAVAEKYPVEKAGEIYSAQARQMRLLGFNLNLAPVVESSNDRNSAFLGSRSFGSVESVVSYASAEISAFDESLVGSVLKHFPGNTDTDPHTGLPELRVTKDVLENEYLKPFESLLPDAHAVLLSHARVSVTDDDSYDDSAPVCLSKFWVTDIIRDRIGFDGLIFSDDIFMGALADNGFPPEKACVMAIEAGVDCIMLSEKKFGSVAKVLLEHCSEDEAFERRIKEAVSRVIKYKIDSGILEFKRAGNTDSKKAEDLEFSVVPSVNMEDFDSEEFDRMFEYGTELLNETE